ncbi:MAG TPA: CBS domain-containing protein [Candidatus Bathyarchaeia archaeon]|nr:CBS domain-containing protein [Candidatus Bathyarchaeia archaeon]
MGTTKAEPNRTLNGERIRLLAEAKGARDFLLCEVLGKKVMTKSGLALGKLKDFVFVDDPKYAEVTSLVVGRRFGRVPLNIPRTALVAIDRSGVTVMDPPPDGYAELKHADEELLLRGKILDKKIFDLEGSDVEVVYDIQLLFVENHLFVVAADVGRDAMMRRLGLGFLTRHLLHHTLEEPVIPWKYVQPLGSDLTDTAGNLKLTVTKRGLGDIHHEDLADILEELDREDRIHIFDALDTELAANTLGATEPRVQREILADVLSRTEHGQAPSEVERITKIFSHMSPAQVAAIVSVLPFEDSEELQKVLKPEVATRVRELVASHDVPASTLAVHRFIAFRGDLKVEDVLKRFREVGRYSIVTMYVYVVDEENHLNGVLDINELLQADNQSKLSDIMTRNVIAVKPTTMRGGIEALFNRYHFRAIPVVDEHNVITGVVREIDVFLKD